jgi:DNA-binding response OmpR family regulator
VNVRPKKRILLIDAEELNISTIRLMLKVQGFLVSHATDVATALKELEAAEISVVLVNCFTLEEGDRQIGQLKAAFSYIPMVFVTDQKKAAGLMHAADALVDCRIPAAELLDRIKVWTTRKRGPRILHRYNFLERKSLVVAPA